MKNNEKPWKTVKNQPGTMKNHNHHWIWVSWAKWSFFVSHRQTLHHNIYIIKMKKIAFPPNSFFFLIITSVQGNHWECLIIKKRLSRLYDPLSTAIIAILRTFHFLGKFKRYHLLPLNLIFMKVLIVERRLMELSWRETSTQISSCRNLVPIIMIAAKSCDSQHIL